MKVRFKLLLLTIFIYGELPKQIIAKAWWENAVFYQVYPRSFKDTNNDGIGDIDGVIEKLDHLRDAGINALWMSPVLQSPQADFGYDISNFTEVDKIFGTNDDLKVLFKKAKEMGIKIIMDFVPNHTSDEHDWFVQSKAGVAPYTDYYLWHPGTVDENNKPVVPNNWQSVFYGSAWEWVEERKAFYLHQFDKKQPDLNYRNPEVVKEMKAVLTFWLDMGANGFRIDAINHMYEDEEFRDEPVNPGATDPLDYGYTDHIYTKDLKETYEMVYQYRELCDEYQKQHGGDDIVLMTEAYASFENTQSYYGTSSRKGSHVPFNFIFLGQLSATSSAKDFHNTIHSWYDMLEDWQTPNWLLGNHDTSRVASRFGENMVNVLNTLILTLPGIAITYNGEEIGMVDHRDISYAETVDPQACNKEDPKDYQSSSRDPERTPFQWDDSTYAGFTTIDSAKPWLPVHPEYKKRNLKKQNEAPNSVYKYYKRLIEVRREPIFTDGDFKSTFIGNNVLVYSRSNAKYGTNVILLNLNEHTETVDISTFASNFPELSQVVLAAPLSAYEQGATVNSTKIVLTAYDALILQPKINLDMPVEKEWWETAVFYQIYPRSFKDSNGDGVGDLQGIISKLDHLKDIGVTATWLSPILKSPMADFGYDISDFEKVDPIFGTDADLLELFEKAKTLGIKVIMDFVPNHTSDEHEWFVKSVAKDPAYEDFYMWHDGKLDENGKRSPPNNWRSAFSGSAWEWNEARQQYYLHQFHKKQPDLNYRNPAVVTAMKQVLKFWLDKGASGFRMDAVNTIFEVEDLRDNPRNPYENNEESTNYVYQHYTSDLKETYEVIYEFRALIDAWTSEKRTDARVMMTEAYPNITLTMKYYLSEDGKKRGSHFPFNFNFITSTDGNSKAHQFKELIETWMKALPAGCKADWVLGNHDQPRVGSRYGEHRIDAMNMLSMTLPGVAITYNGEEIGMLDYRDISWKQTVDPQACNTEDPYNYKYASRDPQRTPFQWDDSENAGFSNSKTAETWLPVNPNYKEINLAKQKKEEKSHYSIYKQLTELRKNNILINGDLKVTALNDRVLAYVRKVDAQRDAIAVVINVSDATEEVDLSELVDVPETIKVLVSSVKSNYKSGDAVNPKKISLLKYDGLVLSTESYKSSSARIVSSLLVLGLVIINFIRF